MKHSTLILSALLAATLSGFAQSPITSQSGADRLFAIVKGDFPGTSEPAMNVCVFELAYAWTSHQEFGGRVTNAGSWQGARVGYADPASDGAHCTRVVGVIASSGVNPSLKGACPACKVRVYPCTIDNSGNNNTQEIVSTVGAMLTSPDYTLREKLISNHSYDAYWESIDAATLVLGAGAYNAYSAVYDSLSFNNPYWLMVTVGGNEGGLGKNPNPNSYAAVGTGQNPAVAGNYMDRLASNQQTAKNPLVVANFSWDTEGKTASSISPGPTDDLRIKPDISAAGEDILTTTYINDGQNPPATNSSATVSGTSIAAPTVAGVAALLQQIYYLNTNKGSWMKAATLKGLMMLTAGNIEPNAFSGYGLVNAGAAGEAIDSRGASSFIEELRLTAGVPDMVHLPTRWVNGGNSIRVGISWTDPAVNSNTLPVIPNTANIDTKRLVNDLNVVVNEYDEFGTLTRTFQPFVLTKDAGGVLSTITGENHRDVFEKIRFAARPKHKYYAVIDNTGTLQGGAQDYSLIVTGLGNDNAEERLTCTVHKVVPAVVEAGATFSGSEDLTAECVIEPKSGLVVCIAPIVRLGNNFNAKNGNVRIFDGSCVDLGEIQAASKGVQPGSDNIDGTSASGVEILYPNPTDGIATLRNTAGLATVTVSDMSGRIIITNKYDGTITSCKLDLQAMAPGVYLVTASQYGGGVKTYKLVKK